MKKLIAFMLLAIPVVGFSQQSIYDLEIDSIGSGSKIKMERFRGSKLLIVNIASLDTGFSQLLELKKLKQMNEGKLAVLVVPSNDFNSEPAGEAAIGAFLSRFNIPFTVAKKVHVKGADMHPLYKWLTRKNLNGVEDGEVKAPFQKYLVSKNGRLTNVFAPGVHPLMDKAVKQKIEKDEN